MEEREPVCLNAIAANGIGLQVRFSWQQDRHIHTISLIIGDRTIPVLESVEGSSYDKWPPSPPLQQISVEPLRPNTDVALLVGMAGKSHWSISVEPASDKGAIAFDVACKSREAAEQLGSYYKLCADGFTILNKHKASLEIEEQTLELRCDDSADTASLLKEESGGIRIEPTSITDRKTTRWRYLVELL